MTTFRVDDSLMNCKLKIIDNNIMFCFLSTEMAVCVHLLLLLVPVLSFCGATQYYVIPTEPTNTSCPAQPCHTLNHYTNHSDHYFKSNTVFKFLPGTHLMDRALEIRDVENISLEASDDNSEMYPQLVAQFICQYEAIGDCIELRSQYVCCSAIRMINVTHAAIQGMSVTVTTPRVSGVILQQCSHLHIQSISIQERNNNNNGFVSNECGIVAYDSSAIASNFSTGVWLYKSRNTSMTNVSAAHNGNDGIRLDDSTDTSMMNVSAAHNRYDGIDLNDSTDTQMIDVSAAHNGDDGIDLDNSTDTSMTNVSAAHNGDDGIELDNSTDTSMTNVSSAHNGDSGIELDYSTDTSMTNVSTANNQHSDVTMINTANTYMTYTACLITAYKTTNIVLTDTSFSNLYAPSTASSISEPTSLPAVITLYSSTLIIRDCNFTRNNISSIKTIGNNVW